MVLYFVIFDPLLLLLIILLFLFVVQFVSGKLLTFLSFNPIAFSSLLVYFSLAMVSASRWRYWYSQGPCGSRLCFSYS
jgi:hypothetical protein